MMNTRSPRLTVASFLLMICLALSTAARADDPRPPDPLKLTPQWSKYFDVAGDALVSRARALARELEQLRGQLPADQLATTEPLLDEIGFSAQRFVRARGQTPPAAAPERPFADRYSLTDLSRLAGAARDGELEAQILQQELDREAQALDKAKESYETLLAAYLQLGATDPQLFPTGLALIRDGLSNRAGEVDAKLRRQLVETTRARAKRLKEEIAVAAERLSVTDADVQTAQGALAAARRQVETLLAEAKSLRLKAPGYGGSPSEQALARQHAQAVLNNDAKLAGARLEEAQEELMLTLAEVLGAPARGQQSTDRLKAELEKKRAVVTDVERALGDWRLTTDREVVAIYSELAAAEEAGSGLADLHRKSLGQVRANLEELARLAEETAKAKTLAQVADAQIIKSGGGFAARWQEAADALAEAADKVGGWAKVSLFTIGDTPVTFLGLLQILIAFAAAWWLAKVCQRALMRAGRPRNSVNPASLYALSRLLRYAILVIGGFVGLTMIGIDLTQLAILASALSVGIGFGLQTIFNNFVAGLIILADRSLKVGDQIELQSGTSGEVREINIRSTRVRMADGVDILVPNSDLVQHQVKNWTLSDRYRRLHIPFGVAYGTDKSLLEKAVLEAAERVEFTLLGDPAHQASVLMTGFGDNSLNFELAVWLQPSAVAQAAIARSAYCRAIDDACRAHGIEMPFPQRDLHIRSAAPLALPAETRPAVMEPALKTVV